MPCKYVGLVQATSLAAICAKYTCSGFDPAFCSHCLLNCSIEIRQAIGSIGGRWRMRGGVAEKVGTVAMSMGGEGMG
jgi:hypothetical protein